MEILLFDPFGPLLRHARERNATICVERQSFDQLARLSAETGREMFGWRP